MSNLRTINPDVVAKVSAPNLGAVPTLQWVAIAELVVDDTYQRELGTKGRKQIGRIAAAFSWQKFQTVEVCPVEGGKYAIIDGQHRVHAAAACGVEHVPCRICPMSNQEAAAAFAAMNGDVQKVTVFNIYKAALAAQEPWAIEARDAVADAGGQLLVYPVQASVAPQNSIMAISTVRNRLASSGRAAVVAGLSLVLKTYSSEYPEMKRMATLHALIDAMADRPDLCADPTGVIAAIDGGKIDLTAIRENAMRFIEGRRRMNVPCASLRELFAADLSDAIQKRFPRPLEDAA